MNTITTHPKLAIFGIGLAITFVIGTSIGIVDQQISAIISPCITPRGC